MDWSLEIEQVAIEFAIEDGDVPYVNLYQKASLLGRFMINICSHLVAKWEETPNCKRTTFLGRPLPME